MSVLSKLKIVAVPPKSGLTPEQQRRAKVIAKLQEQLKLAEAALGGPAYKRQRWGWATDENGEKVKVPRPIRIWCGKASNPEVDCWPRGAPADWPRPSRHSARSRPCRTRAPSG